MRHFSRGRNGMNASFLSCNRNKRSLAVNLKSAEGLEIIKKLIVTAAVLVHNFRPGIADRMGLGEPAVRSYPARHCLRIDHWLRNERSLRQPTRLIL